MRRTIPIFPLHSVLFPGGPLELRIFEPRYLDMVSRCLKEESGFGVCLIRDGEEVGSVPEIYPIGTYSEITYWHKRPDGLFGITINGRQRFRILEQRVERNNLLVAEVEMLAEEPVLSLPPAQQPLARLLERIMTNLDHPYINLVKRYDDAAWVGARLAELLPLPLAQKQLLLQQDDALGRLERLFQLSRPYLSGE